MPYTGCVGNLPRRSCASACVATIYLRRLFSSTTERLNKTREAFAIGRPSKVVNSSPALSNLCNVSILRLNPLADFILPASSVYESFGGKYSLSSGDVLLIAEC